MNNIYSFIFYLSNQWYKSYRDDNSVINSLGIITLLQFFVITGFIYSICNMFGIILNINKINIAAFVIVLLLINYIYICKKIGIENINNFWNEQSSEVIKKMKILTILHFIISISFFIIAIWSRS